MSKKVKVTLNKSSIDTNKDDNEITVDEKTFVKFEVKNKADDHKTFWFKKLGLNNGNNLRYRFDHKVSWGLKMGSTSIILTGDDKGDHQTITYDGSSFSGYGNGKEFKVVNRSGRITTVKLYKQIGDDNTESVYVRSTSAGNTLTFSLDDGDDPIFVIKSRT